MSISISSNSLAISSYQSKINTNKFDNGNGVNISSGTSDKISSLDFTNITAPEFNDKIVALQRSGVLTVDEATSLLQIPIPQDNYANGLNYFNNSRQNFLNKLQDAADFGKSMRDVNISKTAEIMQSGLNKLKALQGTAFSIQTSA